MKKRKIDPLEEIMSNPYYQLRDDYNYAEKVKGTISFGQYSMKYWALERDIVLDGTKSEITEERFVKAIMDARKEGEILNDEDEVNGARKIRRYDCPKESGICFQRNQAPSVTSDSSMIRYTSDSKHHKR